MSIAKRNVIKLNNVISTKGHTLATHWLHYALVEARKR